METRVLVKPTVGGFDAWAPEVPGCAARGATEAEALRNLQHAIEGHLDLLNQMDEAESGAAERTIRVERREELVARLKQEAAIPPEPIVPVSGWTQVVVGGTLFVLALVGIAFYFMAGPIPSPLLLFLPFMLLALGAGGLIFGLLTLQGQRSKA